MPPEPAVKRTVAFFDGQSLFYAAKKAFGYPYPNYAPKALAERIARARGWSLTETFFYTGIPDPIGNAFWNHFWTAKLAVMGTRGIQAFSRSLRYRNQTVRLPIFHPLFSTAAGFSLRSKSASPKRSAGGFSNGAPRPRYWNPRV